VQLTEIVESPEPPLSVAVTLTVVTAQLNSEC